MNGETYPTFLVWVLLTTPSGVPRSSELLFYAVSLEIPSELYENAGGN